MSKQLDFIFDFGSPNAYLAYKALPPILARTGATLNTIPCLLGGIFKATGNKPPMLAYGGVTSKMAYEELEMRRFMAKHDLTRFVFNPHFPVNTLTMMRGAIVAQRNGAMEEFIDAGLACLWEQGLKMDDPDVFVAGLTDAGLDGQGILDGSAEQAVKDQLIENTSAAVARGVFGVPTFFVGGEMFFGKDRLQQVEDALSG